MIYVSQIIMPYTLNLYSAIYQLYLKFKKQNEGEAKELVKFF